MNPHQNNQSYKIKTTTIELTQKEANLLLRALEEISEKKSYKENALTLWNKIFDIGIEAGFGKQND